MTTEVPTRPIRRVVSIFAEVVVTGPEALTYGQDAAAPDVAEAIFRKLIGPSATLQTWVLLLDKRQKTIGVAQASLGPSLSYEADLYFGPALRVAASRIIVGRNKPGEDPRPCHSDFELAYRLASAGRLLHVSLLDYLILSDTKYVSLRERLELRA